MAVNVDAIKKLMDDSQLSPGMFARRIGVSRQCVYRILSGERQPGSKFLSAVKRAFPDCSLDQIFMPSLSPISDTGTDGRGD